MEANVEKTSPWRFMNPLEWLKIFYEWFGVSNPIGSRIVVTLLFGLIGFATWSVAEKLYYKDHPKPTPTQDQQREPQSAGAATPDKPVTHAEIPARKPLETDPAAERDQTPKASIKPNDRSAPPVISQRSEGPNSPNIIGPGTVTYNINQPWTLTPREREKIGEMLRGTKVRVFTYTNGNSDAISFERSITLALQYAGWSVEQGGAETAFPSSGVFIGARSADSSAAKVLRDALRAVGVNAHVEVMPTVGDSELELSIDSRPQ